MEVLVRQVFGHRLATAFTCLASSLSHSIQLQIVCRACIESASGPNTAISVGSLQPFAFFPPQTGQTGTLRLMWRTFSFWMRIYDRG